MLYYPEFAYRCDEQINTFYISIYYFQIDLYSSLIIGFFLNENTLGGSFSDYQNQKIAENDSITKTLISSLQEKNSKFDSKFLDRIDGKELDNDEKEINLLKKKIKEFEAKGSNRIVTAVEI